MHRFVGLYHRTGRPRSSRKCRASSDRQTVGITTTTATTTTSEQHAMSDAPSPSPPLAEPGPGRSQDPRRPHVVVVGGGFGGLNAVRALADAPVRVSLVDRRNHHLFQPLLYQVATAALSPADIASPIRAILRRQKNVEVLLAEATAVDLAANEVVLDTGRLPYDYLILAAGASHSYFGHDEWAPIGPGLKTLEDALTIRRRVLLAYEEAERTTDPAAREARMSFVVVGGGPTGAALLVGLAVGTGHFRSGGFARSAGAIRQGETETLRPW
jgi:NADPH-dependent 2,4-dienoyl-CoA reductase/sulfur reductase-like enzyme